MTDHVIRYQGELRRRAKIESSAEWLEVDYYRVHRRLGWPLPLDHIPDFDMKVAGIELYPWETWFAWRWEERLLDLGAATDDPAIRGVLERDLLSISQWRAFPPCADTVILSPAHFARALVLGLRHWRWCDGSIRDTVLALLRSDAEMRLASAANELDEGRPPHLKRHNISLIGLMGIGLSLHAVDHPAAHQFNEAVLSRVQALLDAYSEGYSEGISYDGYVLSFVAPWLDTIAAAASQRLTQHEMVGAFIRQATELSAPGDAHAVAPLGDVEPERMTFWAGAAVAMGMRCAEPATDWLLTRCDPARLDAASLVLGCGSAHTGDKRSAADARKRQGAVTVLRSGWDDEDVAVAVSASSSQAHHLHFDGGSVTIGTRGRWFVTDPGYQDYAPGPRRDFTIGPHAHNAPILDGQGQSRKAAALRWHTPQHAEVVLDQCYALPTAPRVSRHVVVTGKSIEVRDHIQPDFAVSYYWHFPSDAALRLVNGVLQVRLAGATLEVSCENHRIAPDNVVRLPAADGLMTCKCDMQAIRINWAFRFSL